MNLPKFILFGEDDPNIETALQPALALRKWTDLSAEEKQIAFLELKNNGWLKDYSKEVLQTIEYLNHAFLRQCPGRHLHAIKPERDNYHGYGNDSERIKAALMDFQHIFLQEKSEAMVMRMLSYFADRYINKTYLRFASEAEDENKRHEHVRDAYDDFDRLANCLNHIFEQFAINQLVTRSGFVPRQDAKITQEIYVPTLVALSDPKWKPVSDDLAKMFDDYRNQDFPETITKAHSAVQRFLQILTGEGGTNARGELGRLFKTAKDRSLIPTDRFTEPMITVIHGYLPSERATNSTAKPALKDTTSADALLMMNVVMILLQHCLQRAK